MSEPWIVCTLARALLPENARTPWEAWSRDYALVRLAIERTYPEIFREFERRRWQPGGFARPLAARQRIWKTENGKANFIVPSSLDADPDMAPPGGDVLRLMTLRSNDQFNTTVYGYDDRFRGVSGTRSVLMMHADDIARLGLRAGDLVVAATVADDARREVSGLRVTPHDIPRGCAAAYYPECNPLLPLWHHAAESKVPAAKSIPIRLRKLAAT